MLAPLWCDVDMDGWSGAPGSDVVLYKIRPHYMIVRWDSVGYYFQHQDKLNSFEVIISDGTDPIIPGGNNVEFCYQTMQWTTGDASGGSNGFGGSAATAGANEGDGIHYIQFGLFDQPGNSYAQGQYPGGPPYDGVGWLSNRSIIFNACSVTEAPAVSGVMPCDTFKLCLGDTASLHVIFFSPRIGDTTWSNLFPPPLNGVSIINNAPGPTDSLVLQMIGTTLNYGTHTINLYGYDNEIPSDTTFASFVLEVDSVGGNIVSSADTICLGDSVQLKVITNANQFLWSTGQTIDSVEEHPTVTTTYDVLLTKGACSIDATKQIVVLNGALLTITKDSICAGDSTTLTVSQASSFVWSNGATTSSITVKPDTSTTYSVYAHSNCGYDTLSKKVWVYPIPVINIDGPDSICKGNSATLTDTTSGTYSYLWSTGATTSSITVSPTVTTTYSLSVSTFLCSNDTTFTVVVSPKAVVNITVTPSPAICFGDSTLLTAVGNGSYYVWLNTNQIADSIWVKPASTTTYSVVCHNICGIPDTNTTVITIYPLPAISFSADTASGCMPVCTLFNNTTSISSGSVVSWLWTFGDGTTDTAQTPYHCFANPGNYNVSLTAVSGWGCVDTLTVANMIKVYDFPVAAFTLAPQPTTIIQPKITFTDKSTDAKDVITSWLWTFGDGMDSTATTANAVHTYSDTGVFCPTLVVTNQHGCMDSVTDCLVISPQYTLYIPSGFSPNADGKNDIFQPVGNAAKDFKMYIFDRWGNLLYYTNDIYKGWNGSTNGGSKVCQEDTYIYMISCRDNFGKPHSYVGKITLVR